jgi:D-arabinose 1-dehydrogenase-like Zn-dependent alcohol dehydrogenase
MMAKMRAVQVSYAKGPWELVERDIPEPGVGQVRIRVQACGVCHSEALVKEGTWPGVSYPRIPGHEVAGVIETLGSGVEGWNAGQRVGVGWYGGHCGHCNSCRRGELDMCENRLITGVSFDGGYADYMVAPASALALIPDELTPVEAAPLMCAGITTFNALRNSGPRAGEVVAVLGVGGLGHLGVQYAAKMGFTTVAIARGQDKGELARQLGARHYIDSTSQDVPAELGKLGGAKVILSTVTNAQAINEVLDGLGVDGKLIVAGVTDKPLEIMTAALVARRRSVKGWYSGTAIDSQDTMEFSVLAGVRSMNEVYPLERAAEAYEFMMSGKARFRVVLTTGA